MSDPTLRIDGLAKRFGGLQVFDGISMALPPGGMIGVIGPNGAGKTTLINVVCGMLAPTAGTVRLGERDLTGLALHRVSAMGVVRSFQQTNTFGTATVAQNLDRAARFGSRRHRGDPAWSEAGPLGTLMQEFGLDEHLDDTSGDLPYGQQKMLGLLMAVAARPRFLLLDEPAAGLELSERTRVDRLVQHVRHTLGCGVLIVEHDMDMIRRLCPSILVLESGRVLAQGAPDVVLSRRDVIDAYMGAEEPTC